MHQVALRPERLHFLQLKKKVKRLKQPTNVNLIPVQIWQRPQPEAFLSAVVFLVSQCSVCGLSPKASFSEFHGWQWCISATQTLTSCFPHALTHPDHLYKSSSCLLYSHWQYPGEGFFMSFFWRTINGQKFPYRFPQISNLCFFLSFRTKKMYLNYIYHTSPCQPVQVIIY